MKSISQQEFVMMVKNNLRKDFSGCIIYNPNFSGVDLKGFDFSRATLINPQFKGVLNSEQADFESAFLFDPQEIDDNFELNHQAIVIYQETHQQAA